MYDDLFPDARTDSLGQMLRRPASPDTPPGALQGFGSAVADALPYAANTSASAWSAVMEAYGHAAAYRDAPTNALVNGEAPPAPAALQAQTLDQMGRSETARGFREQARRYAPDPASVGIAGQVVHGLISGMAKMTAYAGAGPAGPALFGLDTGINRAQELTDQGVDDGTAAAAGLVSGVAGAATMIVPPALGATRLQSAAIGGVVAPAMTVAEVAGIQAILERADYEKIAAQYQPFDPVNLAVSALAGAAFGGIFHRGRAGERAVSPDEHAAALVMNEARTRDADTLTRPGDIEAATAAHDAQARAREQLERGELVSVAEPLRPDGEAVARLRKGVLEQMPADTGQPAPLTVVDAPPMDAPPAFLETQAPHPAEAGILDKVREVVGQFFARQEPEAAAKPATPEQARAAEIVSRSPDAVVRLEDGSEVRMADLLQHADAVEKTAKTERAAFEAAVNCAVRYS